MAKKDERKIQLDPMEWRDAMKDVAATPPAPAPKAKKVKPRAKAKGR